MKRVTEAVFLLFVMSLLIVCGFGDKEDRSEKTSYDMELKSTSSTKAVHIKYDIKYKNGIRDCPPVFQTDVPWSYSFKGHPGDFVYLNAANLAKSGSVTVTILKDGTVLKTDTKTGFHPSALVCDTLK